MNVNFKIGLKAKLPSKGTEGSWYLCKDTGELYYFVDSKMVLVNTTTSFAECSTASGTAAKTVSVTGYILTKGARVTIKFNNSNTAPNPTLNVSSTGAKPIYYNGAPISKYNLSTGKTYDLIYDGTNYVIIGDLRANLSFEVANITTFTLDHELNGYPRVTVLDLDNAVCDCRVVYPTKNKVTLSFNQSFTGTILLDS